MLHCHLWPSTNPQSKSSETRRPGDDGVKLARVGDWLLVWCGDATLGWKYMASAAPKVMEWHPTAHTDTQELLVIYFREVVQSGSRMSSNHVQQPDSIKITLLDTYTNWQGFQLQNLWISWIWLRFACFNYINMPNMHDIIMRVHLSKLPWLTYTSFCEACHSPRLSCRLKVKSVAAGKPMYCHRWSCDKKQQFGADFILKLWDKVISISV